MLVDDFKTNILCIQALLEREGFTVRSSESSREAAKIIIREKFDLILLDVVMPEMDGFTLCEKIRSTELNQDTPVIFITTVNDEPSIVKGFTSGGQDFVTKPFKSGELLAR